MGRRKKRLGDEEATKHARLEVGGGEFVKALLARPLRKDKYFAQLAI